MRETESVREGSRVCSPSSWDEISTAVVLRRPSLPLSVSLDSCRDGGMAVTPDLGSGVRKDVRVRLSLSVPLLRKRGGG